MTEVEVQDKAEDIFDCPICLEQVNIPKCLPCLHTFCEACLQTYISTMVAQKDNQLQNFECPVCRRETGPPLPNVSLDEWAKHFPTNNLIFSLTMNSMRKSEISCSICKRSKKESMARNWCINCEEAVCDECKNLHTYIKQLQNHKIISLDIDDTSALKQFELLDVEEPCKIHQNKFIEVYCNDHKQMCCSVCFATQHRKCESVEALEEIANKTDKNDIEFHLDTLAKLIEKVGVTVGNQRKLLETLQVDKQEILSKTASKIEEIKILLDNCYAEWKKDYEMRHENKIQLIETSLNGFKRFQTTVNDARRVLHALSERGSQKQLFITSGKLRGQIFDHMEKLKVEKTTDTVYMYKFEPDHILQQISTHDKLHPVGIATSQTGAVEEISTLVNLLCRRSERIPRADEQWLSKVNLTACYAEKISEFSFKYPDSHYYAVFLQGNIVVSSNTARSIYIYHLNGTMLHTERFTESPYGLATGAYVDELYICFGNKICKYNVNIKKREFLLEQEIPFEKSIKDFVVLEDNIVSVSESCIFILKSSGKITKSIPCNIHGSAPYVAFSISLGYLAYVQDNNTVICRNMDWTEVFRYKCENNPRGIAFDLQNNIYVCHSSGDYTKVTQICLGKRTNRTLSGPSHSYNIAFHPDGRRFLVMSRSKCELLKFNK